MRDNRQGSFAASFFRENRKSQAQEEYCNRTNAIDTPDDAYKVLGVKEDAVPAEIKRAYRALALKWHPDKVLPDQRSRSEKLFKALGCAYDTLRDPQRRERYDQDRAIRTPDVSSFRPASPEEEPVASPPRTPAMERRRLFRQRSAARSAASASHSRSEPDLLGSRAQTAATGPPTSHGRLATTFGMLFGVSGQGKLDGQEVLGGHRPVTAPDAMGSNPQGRPPSCRIAFSAASALIGKEVAVASLAMLRTVSQWVANCHGQCLLEIRGCVQRREVLPNQQESLAFARSQRALDFLTDQCFVPAERCRLSNRLGDAYQGIEIRAMTRLDVALVSYAKPDSVELKENQAVLKAVATALGAEGSGSDRKRLFVEVQYSSFSERMANRRLAALLQAFIVRDISRRRFRGQVRAGLADQADFYLYDELPPPPKTCEQLPRVQGSAQGSAFESL